MEDSILNGCNLAVRTGRQLARFRVWHVASRGGSALALTCGALAWIDASENGGRQRERVAAGHRRDHDGVPHAMNAATDGA